MKRYTIYDADRRRYHLPLQCNPDGTPIFELYTGKTYYDASGGLIISKDPDLLMGEFVDRLGELEDKAEQLDRRAEWENEGDSCYCSVCHTPAPVKTVRTGFGTSVLRTNKSNYCPHCGAMMVGRK